MNTLMQYFKWAFAVTVIGLVGCFWLGYRADGTLGSALSFLLIGGILAVLEISLSFDNAIVNANKLKDMSPMWRQRFLTWGILIAVFGMRIVFPLLVVAIAAGIGPIQALHLSVNAPQEYAHILGESELSIAAFGGSFLAMVALSFFMDEAKDVDWLHRLERRLRVLGMIKGITYGAVLLLVLGFGLFLGAEDQATFFRSAIMGMIVFIFVEVLSHLLDEDRELQNAVKNAGLGAFLYLEVLDASFSFDGVIGAFALTNNLFLIAIGLGIGAMYVRSMTIMLVEKETLSQFRFLEHGAFYSIFALSVVMFAQSLVHISEIVTGLLGATIIVLSFLSSLQFNRKCS